MVMRPDHLLGTVVYTALAIGAAGVAWLLVEALGSAVAGTFPTAATRLFC
jgi:hypothetical protein